MARKKAAGPAFTTQTLPPLAVDKHAEHWWLESGGRRVRFSNLDKVFWPDEGYTKGDLLAFYAAVSEVLLPHLRDRPLTMKRMPDGANGPYFYEKQAPSHKPDWIRTCAVEHEDSGGGWGRGWSRRASRTAPDEPRESGPSIVDYVLADDLASLLFVVNLGCIEFHPLHSRCGTIDHPDYFFFDLDPFEPATFDDVRAVALHVKAATEALGLPSFPKTSGATGMQIYVPIHSGPTYAQVRALVEAVGRAILEADPKRATMEWEVPRRAGKVFIDHGMNRRGANIAAVYSVRPEPGATCSTPLTWDEVEEGVHPSDFTITTLPARIERVGDLFEGVITRKVDLVPLLQRLGLAGEEPVPEPEPKLETYAKKRRFEDTPEPAPEVPERTTGDRFVIQKHNATRLHYDLRLERDGVMKSWAVPKGLPTLTGERRLAVQTEDHPIDYNAFEGRIPAGNYGAGEVRIFDRGRYEPLEWEDAKVTFRLHGERLRGEWHLIRTGGRAGGTPPDQWIVLLSKRAVAEQPDAMPSFQAMLAEAGHRAFDDPRWRFEAKLDGVRTLAYVGTDGTRLRSRTGRDQTAQYPELNNLAKYVNALQAVIDGEIVAHDAGGRPSFRHLQQRINLTNERDIAQARKAVPVMLYAFDVLWFDGQDVTSRPVEARRELLEEIVTEAPELRLTLYVDGEGRTFFDAVKALGLEGMIAKRMGSPYVQGKRSKDWRKVKATNRQDCVVLGWTEGGRDGKLGALLLGAYVGSDLRWIGQVGTGFTDAILADLTSRLEPLETDKPASDDAAVRGVKGAHFVRPELVCDVEYLEVTQARKLRAPSFKGLRPDKIPADCVLETPAGD